MELIRGADCICVLRAISDLTAYPTYGILTIDITHMYALTLHNNTKRILTRLCTGLYLSQLPLISKDLTRLW